jgi:tetratricopeptide (TPR) repeat protein
MTPRSSDPAQVFAEAIDLFRQGHYDQAEKIVARLHKAFPDHFDILHLAGLIKLQQGRPAAALGLIEAALARNPQSPEALGNLGMALSALGRDTEALAPLDKALALAPDSLDLLNNRGNVLLRLHQPAEAVGVFERILAREPRHLGVRMNRANALAELGRSGEALAEYDTVLAAAPAQAEAHYNRGNVLRALDRHAEALAAYDRALTLRPDYPNALLNRALALQSLGRPSEALADLDRLLARDNSHADAQHNRALVQLTLGDFRGFAGYEYRWQRSGMPVRRRSFGKPLWLGEYPLARKTILIHAEQGLGDTIQFVRYATVLARSGATVLLEVPAELKPLLARIEGISTVLAPGEPLPAFDVHCPVGSLPLALRTEPATIPAEIPYLAADPARVDKWRARLDRVAPPRAALAWSGRAAHLNDRNRSIALSQLAPLLGEGAGFVSVQRELRESDAATLAALPQLLHVGAELDDFDDTAAVLSLVDLVITVDTSVAHLAGALGRPTWILLPFWPDWRWMLERSDSPWYPTVRLFRQPAPGYWASVIEKVREELAKLR